MGPRPLPLRTEHGRHLLVGPDWRGEKPASFVDVIRLSTNYGGVFPRSFATRTEEDRARAVAAQNQVGVYPLGENTDGRKTWDHEAISQNRVFAPGITAEMLAADHDVARPQWGRPERFWTDIATVFDNNPIVAPGRHGDGRAGAVPRRAARLGS